MRTEIDNPDASDNFTNVRPGDDLTNGEKIIDSTNPINIQIIVKLDGENIKNEYQGKKEPNTTIGSLHEELVNFLNSGTAFIDVSGTQINATTPQQ